MRDINNRNGAIRIFVEIVIGVKKIVLIRHAKSSWKDLSQTDHQRTLNKRGVKDSNRMSQWYSTNFDVPQKIFFSDAQRAKETMHAFAGAMAIPDDKLVLRSDLYHANVQDIYSLLFELDDDLEHVMLFGHNPGFTYFANEFSQDYIDNMSTCGICTIEIKTNAWTQIAIAESRLLHYFYPKSVFNEE